MDSPAFSLRHGEHGVRTPHGEQHWGGGQGTGLLSRSNSVVHSPEPIHLVLTQNHSQVEPRWQSQVQKWAKDDQEGSSFPGGLLHPFPWLPPPSWALTSSALSTLDSDCLCVNSLPGCNFLLRSISDRCGEIVAQCRGCVWSARLLFLQGLWGLPMRPKVASMAGRRTGCQGWWSEGPGQARLHNRTLATLKGVSGPGICGWGTWGRWGCRRKMLPLSFPLLLGFLATDPLSCFMPDPWPPRPALRYVEVIYALSWGTQAQVSLSQAYPDQCKKHLAHLLLATQYYINLFYSFSCYLESSELTGGRAQCMSP